MVYRITGGLAFLCIGLTGAGLAIPTIITAVLCVIAGIALLAGV